MAARGSANLAGADEKFAGSALTHDVAPAASFGMAEMKEADKELGNNVFMAADIDPMDFGMAKGFILGPWAI